MFIWGLITITSIINISYEPGITMLKWLLLKLLWTFWASMVWCIMKLVVVYMCTALHSVLQTYNDGIFYYGRFDWHRDGCQMLKIMKIDILQFNPNQLSPGQKCPGVNFFSNALFVSEHFKYFEIYLFLTHFGG